MKSSICGVGVLSAAEIIQGPSGHRGIRAVVRQLMNQTIAGAAVCAINVWIVITAILGVKKLAQAVFANWQVRRDSNGGVPLAHAFLYREFLGTGWFRRF